ncbi:MAG TPA: nucleotidyltransferase domain-containing protein [Candidatus Tectomicrobia bacterium]|jgi:hypothetical protein
MAVRFGVVFGSQRTGKADAWSDIDVLVVFPGFDTPYDHHTIDLLWHLSARVDSRSSRCPAENASGRRTMPAPSWRLPGVTESGSRYREQAS